MTRLVSSMTLEGNIAFTIKRLKMSTFLTQTSISISALQRQMVKKAEGFIVILSYCLLELK